MMIVQFPDKLLRVSFNHTQQDSRGRRKTICTVQQENGKVLVPYSSYQEIKSRTAWKDLSTGTVTCSRQDNFSRARGRKLALRRALCRHEFDLACIFLGKTSDCVKCGTKGSPQDPCLLLSKEERTFIWGEYHKVHKRPV